MNSEKVKEKNPRGNTICHTFLIVFLFACLFISNYCFLNHIKSANGAIKLRVQHLEKDAEITKDIIVNVSVILRDITYVVTERTKPNVQGTDNRKRRRRNIDKAVNSNGDTQKIMEGTLYSLKREMTALNDRLRILLRYGSESSIFPERGPPGPPGLPGKTGSAGSSGINGRDGLQGIRGPKGPVGPVGPTGLEGPMGNDGIPGINGIPGIPGYNGGKGEKGAPGREGIMGIDGSPGTTGRDGPPGRPGRTGHKGEAGDCHCKESYVTPPNAAEKGTLKKAGNLVYTMWGSSTCPFTSDILFSGQVSVGKFKYKTGTGGSNPICLPLSTRSRRRSGRDVDSIMLGEEEEESETTKAVYLNVTSTTKNTSTNLTTTGIPFTNATSSPTVKPFVPSYSKLTGTRKYVPCAACHIEGKSAKLMIPSRTQCPKSWRIEYQGYLMNYHHDSKESEILCVYDQAMGANPSSDAGIREIISTYMTHLRIDCDTIPCPPFHEDLLKCVVCSK